MDVAVVTYLDEDGSVSLIGVWGTDSESEQECLELLKEDPLMASDIEDAKDMEEAVLLHPRLAYQLVKVGENNGEEFYL